MITGGVVYMFFNNSLRSGNLGVLQTALLCVGGWTKHCVEDRVGNIVCDTVFGRTASEPKTTPNHSELRMQVAKSRRHVFDRDGPFSRMGRTKEKKIHLSKETFETSQK